jgi:hypothetical protein
MPHTQKFQHGHERGDRADNLCLDSFHRCHVLVRGAVTRSGRESFHGSLRAGFELHADEQNLEQSELLSLLELCEHSAGILKGVLRTDVRTVCEHDKQKAAGFGVVEEVLDQLCTHRSLEDFLRRRQNGIVEGRPSICTARHALPKDRHESQSSCKTKHSKINVLTRLDRYNLQQERELARRVDLDRWDKLLHATIEGEDAQHIAVLQRLKDADRAFLGRIEARTRHAPRLVQGHEDPLLCATDLERDRHLRGAQRDSWGAQRSAGEAGLWSLVFGLWSWSLGDRYFRV